MDRRTTLALVISFILLLCYQFYLVMFVPRPPEPAPQEATASAPAAAPQELSAGGAPAQDVGNVKVGKDGGVAVAGAAGQQNGSAVSGPQVTFGNGLFSARLALQGGRLASVKFSHFLDKLPPDGQPIELLNGNADTLYLGETGYLAAGDLAVPNRTTLWSVVGEVPTGKSGELVLAWDNGAGLRFEKHLRYQEGSYLIEVTDRVTNNSTESKPLFHYGQLLRIKPQPADGAPEMAIADFAGPMGFLDGERHTLPYEDVAAQDQVLDARYGWVGYSDKHFLGAIIPGDLEVKKRYYFDYDAPTHRVGVVTGKVQLQPGVSSDSVLRFFIGPKEVKTLDAVGYDLHRSIDYGWFHFLAQPLVHVLLFFHGFIGNYGVAIILLTVIIKLLFYPLADKSYRAMNQMKKLQPKVEALRNKYGKDKQRLNEEMMRLYQENKVNPLGGCLPIVVQIPVFFALYKVLFLSLEMRHAPFALWIHDLSAPDPFYILPLIMGASMFLQHRLNPTPADPVQAKVMMMLPVIFTFFFLNFPSGLVLYWVVNNVLSIAQQLHIKKKMDAAEARA